MTNNLSSVMCHASSGDEGKHMQYVSINWSPVEAAMSFFNISLCLKKII